MALPADSLGMMPDPVALSRGFKRGGVPLVIAARVSGEAKSAFPDGAPKPPPPEVKDDKADAAKDKAADAAKEKTADKAKAPAAKTDGAKAAGGNAKDKKAAPAAAAKGEDKKAEETKAEAAKAPPAPPPRPHVATGSINVIVVADTDFLHDQFWADIREFLGQQVAIPNAHNGSFVLGALENLSGSDALISLRGRGITDRPFELVNELRRNAEQRFRDKEQVLTARLREVQGKLAGLEKQGDGENLVLSDKDRQEIEKFRADFLSVRRELREVKRELRKDIDRLDGVLKFINIAAVPLLIGVASIGWAYRRRRTAHQQPQPAETTP
jgi:hypothetical protein